MEACPFPHPPLTSSFSSRTKSLSHLPLTFAKKFPHNQLHHHSSPPPPSALQSPRGFGPSPKKKKPTTKKTPITKKADDSEEEEEDEFDEGVIPEVVTNRMLNRIGLSVGTPLLIGLLFFPFFYYLKVGLKIDVPTWVPFIVSFIFFGSALVGVSYGIVSTSWDPMREGSLLGWNEAKRNWPVFWQSIWGRSGRN